ncbi:MAG: succinate dehydrogenase/fumarate reductase iron-sulfur subunit [Gemmataceae bacterium]|nr:succinate dehydrogenase/fumarate reductase iron-sulfur subunit [Gemmataceae bacterium]
MNFTLQVWRQAGPRDAGRMATYQATGISPDQSFLEMLDVVNVHLIERGEEAIAFDHDCREGICGSCALVIDGIPHGPRKTLPGGKREAKTTCQTYMRDFADGATIWVEPFRAAAFPVIKDLLTDRAALDRIISAGGYVSANTGGAPDGNDTLIAKPVQEQAMDAAACIGCGACVAACKNASAMLFTAAKVSHLGLLPQGQPERAARVRKMVEQMDAEGFGNCTNYYECEAACPKEISADFIARMNRDYLWASAKGEDKARSGGAG